VCQIASKVSYKVRVVMHDLQATSEGMPDGLALGFPLGMVSESRVVHCRLQMISVEVLRWTSWWWLNLYFSRSTGDCMDLLDTWGQPSKG